MHGSTPSPARRLPQCAACRERQEGEDALQRAASQRLLQETPPQEYIKHNAHASAALDQILKLVRQHVCGDAARRGAAAAAARRQRQRRMSAEGPEAGGAEGAAAPWVVVVIQKLKGLLKDSDRWGCSRSRAAEQCLLDRVRCL